MVGRSVQPITHTSAAASEERNENFTRSKALKRR